MLNIQDPNSLGVMFFLIHKEINKEKKCYDMNSLQKEKKGCRCEGDGSCQKVSYWPNFLTLCNFCWRINLLK